MNEPTLASISLVTGAFIVTWVGVGLFIHWSRRRQLLDIPNERSSHTVPTPRGGGLVIALAGLLGYILVAWIFGTSWSAAYLIAAAMVTLVSWLDDLYSLPFWTRLIVHVAAATVLVVGLGGWYSLPMPFSISQLPLGEVAGTVLTIAWIVWLINAYNFMDGIDGIAGLQAVIASLAWLAIGVTFGLPAMSVFTALLGAISFAFLIHNWQPARIFMGDVGSAFLGFTLAALPLLARHEAQNDFAALPLVAVLFVWFFISDTVYTFVRRAIKGERVWEAHRSHLYQRMVIGGMSHATVTLLYGSAAVVICIFVFLALLFAGIYSILAICSLLVLTFLQVYLGRREKNVDLND